MELGAEFVTLAADESILGDILRDRVINRKTSTRIRVPRPEKSVISGDWIHYTREAMIVRWWRPEVTSRVVSRRALGMVTAETSFASGTRHRQPGIEHHAPSPHVVLVFIDCPIEVSILYNVIRYRRVRSCQRQEQCQCSDGAHQYHAPQRRHARGAKGRATAHTC